MMSPQQRREQEHVIPVMPADWVPGPRQGEWTYEMYAVLPDDGNRYEVVQGVLIMSYEVATSHGAIAVSFPAPSPAEKIATWYHLLQEHPTRG